MGAIENESGENGCVYTRSVVLSQIIDYHRSSLYLHLSHVLFLQRGNIKISVVCYARPKLGESRKMKENVNFRSPTPQVIIPISGVLTSITFVIVGGDRFIEMFLCDAASFKKLVNLNNPAVAYYANLWWETISNRLNTCVLRCMFCPLRGGDSTVLSSIILIHHR